MKLFTVPLTITGRKEMIRPNCPPPLRKNEIIAVFNQLLILDRRYFSNSFCLFSTSKAITQSLTVEPILTLFSTWYQTQWVCQFQRNVKWGFKNEQCWDERKIMTMNASAGLAHREVSLKPLRVTDFPFIWSQGIPESCGLDNGLQKGTVD